MQLCQESRFGPIGSSEQAGCCPYGSHVPSRIRKSEQDVEWPQAQSDTFRVAGNGNEAHNKKVSASAWIGGTYIEVEPLRNGRFLPRASTQALGDQAGEYTGCDR